MIKRILVGSNDVKVSMINVVLFLKLQKNTYIKSLKINALF